MSFVGEDSEYDLGETEPCQKCGRPVPAGVKHPCPYQEEIEDDHEDCCNCCDDCSHECALDV